MAPTRRARRGCSPAQLVLPLFVREGTSEPLPIGSMPGVVQHSLDSLKAELHRAAAAGIGGVMLFGVPEHKDAVGSGATDPDGILNVATRVAVAEVGDALVVQTDLCLDEFTDHGHCGVLDAQGRVDNDATLERYRDMALAQAEAGSQLLGLSGMMDGQVARRARRRSTRRTTAICALSPTPRSTPRRSTARSARRWQSSLQGDRRTYQLDPANRREGAREVALDLAEGADIVMVKPAMSYLDVLADAAAASPVPVWAYQVCGEYAMIEAAAAHGWIDRERAIDESLTGIVRAGADAVLTYWAIEAAREGGTRMTTNEEAAARARPSSPAASTRPCGPSARSAARRCRSSSAAARPCATSRVATTSTSSASWGPALLGHAHPEVVEAVQDAAARGLSFGASTPGESELAEVVIERLPSTACAGSSACGSSRPAPRRP